MFQLIQQCLGHVKKSWTIHSVVKLEQDGPGVRGEQFGHGDGSRGGFKTTESREKETRNEWPFL